MGPLGAHQLRRADQVDLAFYVLLRGVAETAAHAYSLNYRMMLQLRRLPSHDGGLRVWPETTAGRSMSWRHRGDRRIHHREETSGGVRPGAALAQHPGQRLGGVIAVGQERVNGPGL